MNVIMIFSRLCLLVAMCFFSLSVSAVTTEQQTELTLRKIGHEFLLSLNDSTSRVMPVEKIGDRYALRFENPMSFEPELLASASLTVLQRESDPSCYLVEIEPCNTPSVVHSFEVNAQDRKDSMACAQRQLPFDCYVFYFSPYECPIQEKVENASTSVWWMTGVGILAILIAIVVLVMKFRRSNHHPENLVLIGNYQLDQKRMLLFFQGESSQLSAKEADLLALFAANLNETLTREEILKKVWDDEGDYVGRTLDVFISKLRKKLEEDPQLKIINVRGVGYRFLIGE